jgi:hypothetical protein
MFHVDFSGYEGFSTLERSGSFVTGKSFTINVRMKALQAPGRVPWPAGAPAAENAGEGRKIALINITPT